MNSLYNLSTIGASAPPSPARSRAGSEGDISKPTTRSRSRGNNDGNAGQSDSGALGEKEDTSGAEGSDGLGLGVGEAEHDEKTSLLNEHKVESFGEENISGKWLLPKRISEALIGALRVVLSALLAPGRYLVAYFYTEDGKFSAFEPIRNLSRTFSGRRGDGVPQMLNEPRASRSDSRTRKSTRDSGQPKRKSVRSPSVQSTVSIASSSIAVASDSEADSERPSTRDGDPDIPSHHTRSRSAISAPLEEIAPAKRSIRIKLHNEDGLRQRKKKPQAHNSAAKPGASDQTAAEAAAAALKSPTSPPTSSKVTKFPRAPQPPRPLIPRRQPSYTAAIPPPSAQQKTLILDLDETLIHSMAKGGRYTTGHMVEVKLRQSVAAAGTVVGPQVPILYYVHKRPHCDEFLRKISKWYKLVVFTASVQEYADPVIDWLELERKYFAERYYRDHCTIRNGAYIKDLARVEPDLSKVMIIDNSPMSYIFHEDNAIPIEGWINDPTDNDLLHLIPLLEGLQYVTDVRAFLTLRLGQPQPL